MRETELNSIFNIIPDPEQNKVDVSSRKMRQEVERMIRIFDITKAQKAECGGLTIKNLTSFKLAQANNNN